MRIAVIAHFQNDENPSCIYVHAQAQAYRALGHDVVEISPVPWLPKRLFPARRALYDRFTGRQLHDGIPVYYPRMLSLSNLSRWLNARLLTHAAWRVVKKLHRQQPFDILHGHMLEREGYAVGVMGKRLNLPAVCTTHGTDCMRYFCPEAPRFLRRSCLRLARIGAVSPKLKAILDTQLPPEKTVVIYDGYDDGGRAPQPRERSGIVFAGNLIEQKRPALLIRAFAALPREFDGETLTILGRGPLLDDLKALAASLNVAQRVFFPGYVPNDALQRHMAGAKVFALPSVNEGFGIVYVEAMANGCAPIGVKGEGIDGFIRHGENGYLIPPDDETALKQALTTLLGDDELRQRLADQAAADARRQTWRHNAEEYLSLFGKILGES
ncbi:MAG: glycosyltransferase [Eubacteriales bacterium]|nr:glycosyltransferase [Eubacteriales bacterium]